MDQQPSPLLAEAERVYLRRLVALSLATGHRSSAMDRHLAHSH
jgi:hypothetical protein